MIISSRELDRRAGSQWENVIRATELYGWHSSARMDASQAARKTRRAAAAALHVKILTAPGYR
jgi:hypothetical protein